MLENHGKLGCKRRVSFDGKIVKINKKVTKIIEKWLPKNDEKSLNLLKTWWP